MIKPTNAENLEFNRYPWPKGIGLILDRRTIVQHTLKLTIKDTSMMR